jgi:F-type H+-transporting ATPase subunit gamma
MANLKELRNRIASVRNTRKITAAMSQIAAARLKKAQDSVLAARPYGVRMRQMVEGLVAGIDAAERANAHPLMATRKIKRAGLVVLTADRGLCGAFNSNIVRAALRFIEEQKTAGIEVDVTAIGKKAITALKYAKVPVVAAHEAPTLTTLVPLS